MPTPIPLFYILVPHLYYLLFRSLDFIFTENTPGYDLKQAIKKYIYKKLRFTKSFDLLL